MSRNGRKQARRAMGSARPLARALVGQNGWCAIILLLATGLFFTVRWGHWPDGTLRDVISCFFQGRYSLFKLDDLRFLDRFLSLWLFFRWKQVCFLYRLLILGLWS